MNILDTAQRNTTHRYKKSKVADYMQEFMVGRPSREAIQWIQAGLLISAEKRVPFEKAMGYTLTAGRKAARNLYLAKAWQTLEEEPYPCVRCARLEREIKRFGKQWRYYDSMKEPDPDWSKLKQNLFLAFQIAGPQDMPTTDRTIYNIMKKLGVYISTDQS